MNLQPRERLIDAVVGFLAWFLGGLDGLMYVLIAVAAANYFTAVMCVIINKKLSNEVGTREIFKKIAIFLLVGIGHLLDMNILDGSALRTTLLFFYISNEGISLVENCAIIGLPIPKGLKDVISQIRNKSGKINMSDKDDEQKGE